MLYTDDSPRNSAVYSRKPRGICAFIGFYSSSPKFGLQLQEFIRILNEPVDQQQLLQANLQMQVADSEIVL